MGPEPRGLQQGREGSRKERPGPELVLDSEERGERWAGAEQALQGLQAHPGLATADWANYGSYLTLLCLSFLI